MAETLERIHRFEHEVELAGTETVPSPLGHAVLTPELSLRHDSNYLYLERANDAAEAVAEAKRTLGADGRDWFSIMTFDEELGARLRPQFATLGWRTIRHVFMAQLRQPEKQPDLSRVEEVDEASLRPGRRADLLAQPWCYPALAEQLLDSKLHLAKRAETRFFAVRDGGEIVAWSDLYLAQGVAQVEDVATAEEHRGKGYASAVVLRAAEEGRKAGADLVFLVADDEDWPKELYRRLGFDPLGLIHKFSQP